MKTILITAIGGDIAQAIASILRENKPEYRLVGTDMEERHGGSLFVDAFFKVPSANETDYIPRLKSIIANESVNIFLPMSEAELAALLPLQAQAEFKDLHWIHPGKEVVMVGLDKFIMAKKLAEFGLSVPWTISVDEGWPLVYPCIFKNRRSSGSRMTFTVYNYEEAVYLKERFENAIFQEMLLPADQEVTCAVYRTLDGRVIVLQMLRRLIGGFTNWAKVIYDEKIQTMCEIIANNLRLRGSMNVQLRRTSQGPRIFEINSRFSSTVFMRHRLGFTDVLWTINELEGKKIQFPKIPLGEIVVRTQSASILLNKGCDHA